MNFLESIDDCSFVDSICWFESNLQKCSHFLRFVIRIYHDLNFRLTHDNDTITNFEIFCIVDVLLSVLLLLMFVKKLSFTFAKKIFNIEYKISNFCNLKCVNHVFISFFVILNFNELEKFEFVILHIVVNYCVKQWNFLIDISKNISIKISKKSKRNVTTWRLETIKCWKIK